MKWVLMSSVLSNFGWSQPMLIQHYHAEAQCLHQALHYTQDGLFDTFNSVRYGCIEVRETKKGKR